MLQVMEAIGQTEMDHMIRKKTSIRAAFRPFGEVRIQTFRIYIFRRSP
jgi:hypothetical protein